MSWFGENKVESDRLEKAISRTVEGIVQKAFYDADSALSRVKELGTLTATVTKLKEELETLRIEKGRKEEDFAKREREIEHKVGLEKKRQEFELAASKRETIVTVKEENLAADKKRFEEQMKFHTDRFTAEVGYLKDIMEKVLSRLPSAEMKIRHTTTETSSTKTGAKTS